MLSWTSALLRLNRDGVQNFVRAAVARRQLSVNARETSEQNVEAPARSEPPKYTVDSFSDLIKSDEDRKKVHLILLELASLQEDSGRAPTTIKQRDMRDMLLQSFFQRRKYFEFMFKREMSVKNFRAKQALKREQYEEERLKNPKKEIPPGLFPFLRSSFLHRHLYGRRLAEAAMFGQKVVFDCGFSEHMTSREVRNCADQLQLAYAANKVSRQPFDLTFCNVTPGSFMNEVIDAHLALMPGQHLIDKMSESYLDVFPREKLVYLSPDARKSLHEWDHDAIFVIGSIVDLGSEKPLTLAKAKREGIACASLPLMNHITLKQGAQKTLTLNTVLEILLVMRETNDWRKAFQKLPSRFVEREGQSVSRLRSVQRHKELIERFVGGGGGGGRR